MKLISTLIFKFLSVPMFRNVTLSCLTEIAGVTVSNYEEKQALLVQTMEQLEVMLPSLPTSAMHMRLAGTKNRFSFKILHCSCVPI